MPSSKLDIEERGKEESPPESNGLAAIQALRPKGPRRLWQRFDSEAYRERLEGAFFGIVLPERAYPCHHAENQSHARG